MEKTTAAAKTRHSTVLENISLFNESFEPGKSSRALKENRKDEDALSSGIQ